MLGLFKAYTDISFPACPFCFWLGPCLPQLLLPQVAAVLNSYYWLFFYKSPRKRLFSLNKVWIRSNKDKSCKWGRHCQESQIVSLLWEWCFWGNSKTVLFSPVAPRLLVSQLLSLWSSWFLRFLWSRGEGNGNSQVKMPSCSRFILRFTYSA